MAHLGHCLLSINPQKSEGLQQTVHDSKTMLPKLATGLDVNGQFTGVSDFEYTSECRIFDLQAYLYTMAVLIPRLLRLRNRVITSS